jgi:hypothetical protein
VWWREYDADANVDANGGAAHAHAQRGGNAITLADDWWSLRAGQRGNHRASAYHRHAHRDNQWA